MVFSLRIELGNEAMQTGEDVGEALARVALTVSGATFELVDGQGIRDANGNTVGRWEVTSS